jgi:hypothetical protein
MNACSFIQKTAITTYPCSQTSVEKKNSKRETFKVKYLCTSCIYTNIKKTKLFNLSSPQELFSWRCTILHTRGFVKFIMLMPTKQSEGEHTILLALFTSKDVYISKPWTHYPICIFILFWSDSQWKLHVKDLFR